MTSPASDRGVQQQAIVDAALRTIAERGYGAASLAAIAEEAGTTKRMVLYYFDSRDQLLLHVADRVAAQLVERAKVAAAEQQATTLGDAVAESFRDSWERLAADPVLLRAYLAVLADGSGGELQAAALARVRAAHSEIFAMHVARGRAAGLEPPVDEAVLSVVLFSMFRGLVIELLERGPSTSLDGAIDFVADALRGLFAGR